MKKYVLLILLFSTFYLSLLPFDLQSQWVQMTAFPVSGSAYSVSFINKDTGYVSMDTPALLRTTDGGQSWTVVGNYRIYHLQFVNSLYGYGNGRRGASDLIYKTTDGGFNWDSVSISSSFSYDDLYFVNKDTGWISGFDGTFKKIWRTTNGGISLESQHTGGVSGTFANIFMLKEKMNGEYYGWWVANPNLFRTTNSGQNWNMIYSMESIPMCGFGGQFVDFYFTDTINGAAVRSGNCIMLTTNGGYDWSFKSEPGLGSSRIGMATSQIGWMTKAPDTVLKTYNFFQTYGKQYHPSFIPGEISVLDTSYAFTVRTILAKTTNGGGPVLSVNQISSEIPSKFELNQNYPNPFNPTTNIEFSIPERATVTLIIHDILGREAIRVVNNEEFLPGRYSSNIDFIGFTAGIYFYRITIINSKGEMFSQTKKMIYAK